jgi:hypothetical protein
VGERLEIVGAVELTIVIVDVLLLMPPTLTYTTLLPCVIEVEIVTVMRLLDQYVTVPATEPTIT